MSLVLISSLVGCTKTQYEVKFKEVKVPIAMTIKRPNRPIYLNTDSVPTYTVKLIEYTEILEMLIDENNKLVTDEVTNERRK